MLSCLLSGPVRLITGKIGNRKTYPPINMSAFLGGVNDGNIGPHADLAHAWS